MIEERSKKAAVISTASNMIDQFCQSDINLLVNCYEVEVISNFVEGSTTSEARTNEFIEELSVRNITVNNVPFSRFPFSLNNIRAFFELIRLFKAKQYQLIHCHTPVAASLARIAAWITYREKCKVIYTAHGFHFYEGAPLKNWLLFYPIEKILSRVTNTLITINIEDYEFAKRKLDAMNIAYIPGVGIDLKSEYLERDTDYLFEEFKISKTDTIILSVGELNSNKNHEIIIRAIALINDSNLKYIICGQGNLYQNLLDLADNLNIKDQVILTGYRKDIHSFYKIANIFAFPSFREGLSVALMEAMLHGLPIVCSDIRGNRDLINNQENGFLFNPNDVNEVQSSLKRILEDRQLVSLFRKNNHEKIKEFDINKVYSMMNKIYFT